MSYLRPVFHRKPMLSAISSVFVATFAMVSAAWSLFHFIAGSFCQTQIDASGCPHCKRCKGATAVGRFRVCVVITSQ
ncbi:hypothetical protein EDD18DRAFT_1174915 [Armillaria luteobubalina]|uniref:Uncharacterized protein n=1 Tax=Armillaria luteobubalina TaxID=153913 RepID=A0AA39Q1J7_9AGAR|nr:hypothetical protein EDD18DRAFT_1174915 [Armillaria luteobubalina]